MNWRPNSGPEMASARARMLERARDYFRHQSVLEVSTPTLSDRTATDPHTGSFEIDAGRNTLYLQTSPEHFMKRLLAAGYPDIFQACHVFRYGEAGPRHLPEFTMIEWYRLGFDLQQIMDDTVAMTSAVLAGRDFAAIDRISYSQAFEATLGVDPLSVSCAEMCTALDADDELSRSIGDNIDAWLDLAMATRIAPAFAADRLTLVYHYPANQAALARLCRGDNSVADRFELYCGDLELANGFVELTDAEEQLIRFEEDRRKRAASDMPVPAIDDNLIDALRAGLPECAGVALGLDRLLMIDQGLTDIRQQTTFMAG